MAISSVRLDSQVDVAGSDRVQSVHAVRFSSPAPTAAALSLFFALVQLRLIGFVLQSGFAKSAEAAHGVAVGRPHWRAFQNRILGPYVLEGLSRLFGDYAVAHVFYVVVALTAAGYLAYLLGRELAGRVGGALLFTMFQLGFAALLAPPWLYAWDFLDVIIFFVFIHFVVSQKPTWWFAALFAVAILNRESAQFIALWLVVDPVARYVVSRRDGRTAPLERGRLVVGVACLAAGSAVTELLRSTLLIEEVGPVLFGITAPAGAVNFLKMRIFLNIYWLRQSLTHPDLSVIATIPLLLLGTVWLAAVVARRWPHRFLSLSIVHVAMIGALLAIGNLPESRIYLELMPFIGASCVLIAARDSIVTFS